MLRLLQNKLSNKSLFFREIIIFVTCLHFVLIILFCLLGFKRYNNEKFVINSQSKLGSIIVFMPLKKHVDPAMNVAKKSTQHKKHQSRKVIDYQSYLQKQGYNLKTATSMQKDAPIPKKKPAPKKVKKVVAKKTTLKPIKSKPKVKPKKVITKKEIPKSAPKKIIEPKKKVVQKKVIQKSVAKKPVRKIEQKKVSQKVVKEIKSVPQKEITAQAQTPNNESIDVNDVTFVGYRDLDKLQLQSKIQQAVETFWSPPVGMPKKTKCELQVTIKNNGQVAKAKVVASSRVMAFDLAARSAIHKTKFHRDVWGKQIMVELGI